MLAKTFILSVGLYAMLGLSSPTPEVSAEVSVESNAVETNSTTHVLNERATGVWLDVYKSGACDNGWEDQPKSGWVWAGQCKNFDSFTYGARAGKNDAGWPSACTFKFWENADCHGHATVHHITDSIQWENGNPTYQCIATANKASGEFYLGNGAASVLMTC
ncbi:hypothetical protein Asppvi_011075 [Aspergillus pseudoviridinutans]|uniref:Secreted protein n=1 Tax=Aspergillus pseudoviridinutans TaxID=1517512 RepID=A0A9P3BMM8_9EURO|nr:uncharacterized protein Asppvi_011075 [Aspergillus pseudoviridinutans]GIJ92100.1 hypothetical protein Asppvi_011075 [Aspergillus pseudoviridinutans]